MKKLTRSFVILFILSPLTASAHGEQVLVPLLVDIATLIIFIIGLNTINLNLTGKIILSIIYCLTLGLTMLLMNYVGYLNYIESMGLINVIMFFVPLTIVYLSYLRLKTKFKKV
jgi:hypothetical protein